MIIRWSLNSSVLIWNNLEAFVKQCLLQNMGNNYMFNIAQLSKGFWNVGNKTQFHDEKHDFWFIKFADQHKLSQTLLNNQYLIFRSCL